jgi:apolipoprotein D and lipocalin family protein
MFSMRKAVCKGWQRDYNVKKDKWEISIGKAKFVKKDNVGMLKGSFFGPFLG